MNNQGRTHMLQQPDSPRRAAALRLGFRAVDDSCVAIATTLALRAVSLSTTLLSRWSPSCWEKPMVLGTRRPGRKTTTSPTLDSLLWRTPGSLHFDAPQPMDADYISLYKIMLEAGCCDELARSSWQRIELVKRIKNCGSHNQEVKFFQGIVWNEVTAKEEHKS